jgi:hypothetical protein
LSGRHYTSARIDLVEQAIYNGQLKKLCWFDPPVRIFHQVRVRASAMPFVVWYILAWIVAWATGGYMNPSISRNLKKMQLSANRAQRLLDNMAALGAEDAVVLVDGDNVRGKTSFSISKEKLLSDLHILGEKCGLAHKLQLYYDHGKHHEAYKVKETGIVFSGEKTADDIITRDVAWWKENIGCHVVVVTADSGLKSRCHRAVRADNKALTIIDANLFLEGMDAVTVDRTSSSCLDDETARLKPALSTLPPAPPSPAMMTAAATSALGMRDLLRLELRLRDQVRSLQRLSHKRSGGRKKRAQFTRRLSEIETRLQNCLDKQASFVGVGREGGHEQSADGQTQSRTQSKHVRIDSLDEDTLASVLRDESHGRERREETWERCILAERLRKKLLRSLVLPPSEGDDAAAHAFSEVALASTPVTPMDRYIAEVNRNFSRTDFEGLLLMPKEQALSLLCGSDGSGTSVETGDTTIDADPPRPSKQQLSMTDRMSISAPLPSRSIARPLSTLELRAQRSLREGSHHPPPYSQHTTADGVPFTTDHLGCRVFNVSLGVSSGSATASELPLLKIVCVSDSHAMERALDGLIPSGDVLIHAGDYAGGAGIKSGRGNKNGKRRSRGLDQWLATLPHPVKIVVRGNHDPIIPEFECSGALHYHSSSEVVLERREDGSVITVDNDDPPVRSRARVRLGISPYGSMAVPIACDIMVSHSPPRGVLDATLSKRRDSRGLPLAGKPAGSSELLEAALKQWKTPRGAGEGQGGSEPPVAWLMGHIHESFGAKYFAPWHRDGNSSDGGILAINAACANPGPASTLHNLPTIIYVYK